MAQRLLVFDALRVSRSRNARLCPIANQGKINKIEPRANKVLFDPQEKRITINFDNGNIFSFLTDSVEVISDLSKEVLATVELTPLGKGLRWDKPDIDLSIIGLMMDEKL